MLGTYNRLNVTIWASDREVIRAASRKLIKRCRFNRTDRTARHQFYREMLKYHHKARKLAQTFRL